MILQPLKAVQQLITDCERHIAYQSAHDSQYLMSQLEVTLFILDEGIQLLASSVFESEYTCCYPDFAQVLHNV